MSHDNQQVCLRGHRITSFYLKEPQSRRSFCSDCGESTIHACQHCGSPIRGGSEGMGLTVFVPIPAHCEDCGVAFPWQARKLETAPASIPSSPDPVSQVLTICSRFHVVARQLLTRHSNRTTLKVDDEYDAQDLLHALLRISFDDVRPESWTPDYAGGCSRVDFLLKEEEVVIEVKRSRESLTAKKLGDELIVDTRRYREHPRCRTLVCFVYDPEGWISNPKGLEADLSQEPASDDDITVKVTVVPKAH